MEEVWNLRADLAEEYLMHLQPVKENEIRLYCEKCGPEEAERLCSFGAVSSNRMLKNSPFTLRQAQGERGRC